MKEQLPRLYWSSDKEKLNQIMERLNSKYLVGLYEKLRDFNDQGESRYDDEHELQCSSAEAQYDGYRFTVSRKTLRKELVRRGLILQEDSKSFRYPDGSPKKMGQKRYKSVFRVLKPNGYTSYEMKVKSGKELDDLRSRNDENHR